MPTDKLALQGYFLVGPTAVGKAEVAQWIAERWRADILSADSMQVYRGMDIGTAKLPFPGRHGIEYHGTDLVDPGAGFTVWDYRAHATEVLRRNAARSRRTLIVGGSGLYVKSLTHGLEDAGGGDAAARRKWELLLEEKGVEGLREALRRDDPGSYASLKDPHNPRRLIRALERKAEGSGRVARTWESCPPGAPMAGLSLAPAEAKIRIESRVAAMYRAGLVAEVRRLLQGPGGFSRTARQAIGYGEALQVIEGRCTEEEAMACTVRRTMQLAKRQRTWFRHQASVCWVDGASASSVGEVARRVIGVWETYGPTTVIG